MAKAKAAAAEKVAIVMVKGKAYATVAGNVIKCLRVEKIGADEVATCVYTKINDAAHAAYWASKTSEWNAAGGAWRQSPGGIHDVDREI